ncbi:hypothetical protein TBLA_0C03360 [Henningerozyma blattae CBS 6284]|uniref:PIH1 N-terminal domain-containing protein n=1 Tax=Henningerozyma blattae (strain ATCC 34711 / CBS 6284 / DSM 70876 / NBRC 10599 / NRRL Y-10934 / UCD 77-7) TaxID=1071380 RepID=I2H187_HENB6|nr:hypothetical protein TBLA_0C03360 [Tetrapisispora blattae CBS 6284]CCH60139.1 hypothetical protein TBLA_0C03360 [Tetrapisispora blattae CBS 6284]
MNFLLRPISTTSKSHDRIIDNQINEKNNTNAIISTEPTPLFVIKSKVQSSDNRPNTFTFPILQDKKIFINVCCADEIPKPDVDFNPNIVYPLIMNNKWEIPIVTTSIRNDTDKKGNLCYVCDCCINTACADWISKDLQLREILNEWCLESCELREVIEISRDNIAFPKMKKKGNKIPTLEILSEDLTQNLNIQGQQILNAEKDDPSSILTMKRDLLRKEEEETSTLLGSNTEELPPLFPTHKRNIASTDDANKDNKSKKNPLIQEINQLSINDKDRPVKKLKNPTIIKEDVIFDVQMRKTKNTDVYKLRIEIKSDQITSGLDLSLSYEPKNNQLLLKNLNTQIFNENILKIPLPNIFDNKDNKIIWKCFYTKKDHKLIIFI